jgi:succinoglycan biosynthesis protein ExoO
MVSVIMANYCGGRFIERALESVLAQTMPDLEIIVSDDASPDDSVARIAEMLRRDPRVRLVATDGNGGPARCRNRALAEARGRWIAIVDSDDLIHPERFERILAAAEQSGADIVADDLLHFHDDGTPSRLLLPDGQQSMLEVTAVDWILAGDNNLPPLGYLKPLIRAEALAGLRYDEALRIGEDYDFVLRLLLGGATMQVIPEPWYFYRRHSHSLSHRSSIGDIEAMIAAQKRFVATSDPFAPAVRDALSMRLSNLETALSFEHLVAALKKHDLARAASTIVHCPPIVLRLVRAASERTARQLPRQDVEVPPLVVLSDNDADFDCADAVTIKVPNYQPFEQQMLGGAARRALWRRIADLGRGPRPRIVARGLAGAYAAGFVPRPMRASAGDL